MRSAYFLILVVPVLFSCRKDYACVCTAEDPIHNMTQTANMTQAAAEDWCIRMDIENLLDDEENQKKGWKCELVEL